MHSDVHTIVFVSSDEAAIRTASKALQGDGNYRLVIQRDEAQAANWIRSASCSLIFFDEALAESSESNFLAIARVQCPEAPRVLFGEAIEDSNTKDLVRSSAPFLQLSKPMRVSQLSIAAKRALEMAELSRRHRLLSRELRLSIDDDLFGEHNEEAIKAPWSRFEKLIYASPKMEELCSSARQAAATELPILIEGETGTGKELLARAVHYSSSRGNSPMHVQNCGRVSDDDLHSELFGHVCGAFNGAISDRLGLFRAADGGTVFLDEISEVSDKFQVSLLRFLQEGEVKPLGSDNVQRADVRIIAASNRDLEEMVARGEFRKDLFYRLKGFELDIPPLRERVEDIPTLAAYFLERNSDISAKRIIGISRDALKKLACYEFPGNVRELEMEVARAAALANNNSYILPKHFSDSIANIEVVDKSLANFSREGKTLKEMTEELERHALLEVLEKLRWNQSKAAQVLGVSRVGIANKIRRYDLKRTEAS
ncbi:MAG: sigma-54-dependent Fis family transcriptional regulator [Erythrobacteraceae bacterium]|nr:sigma-54-dependent Fis family transcriptional regulator [Erythrobacteraceae bacterium]